VGLRPIPPNRPRSEALMTSAELVELAQRLSGRFQLTCQRCGTRFGARVESAEVRLGTTVAMRPGEPGRPRLVLRCTGCASLIGMIYGDVWMDADTGGDGPEASRWERLEIDSGPAEPEEETESG
jgi:hypothetical protein